MPLAFEDSVQIICRIKDDRSAREPTVVTPAPSTRMITPVGDGTRRLGQALRALLGLHGLIRSSWGRCVSPFGVEEKRKGGRTADS